MNKTKTSFSVIYGSMNSGKTHTLQDMWKKNKQNSLYIKITLNMKKEDLKITEMRHFHIKNILIDEFQFLENTDISIDYMFELFRTLLINDYNKNIVVASLFKDFKGKTFNYTSKLLLDFGNFIKSNNNKQIDIKYFKKYGNCDICGYPSEQNIRIIKDEALFLTGKHLYKVLCGNCYLDTKK